MYVFGLVLLVFFGDRLFCGVCDVLVVFGGGCVVCLCLDVLFACFVVVLFGLSCFLFSWCCMYYVYVCVLCGVCVVVCVVLVCFC